MDDSYVEKHCLIWLLHRGLFKVIMSIGISVCTYTISNSSRKHKYILKIFIAENVRSKLAECKMNVEVSANMQSLGRSDAVTCCYRPCHRKKSVCTPSGPHHHLLKLKLKPGILI